MVYGSLCAMRSGNFTAHGAEGGTTGWQSTWRKAQGAGKGIRTCTDLYGPSFAGGFGGQAAQGAVRAMFSGVSKAHGLPRRSAA